MPVAGGSVGVRGQRLLRQRSERLERPNAHLYEIGGMRRLHLRGHRNILKRLLVQVCGFNLGLLMRHLTGAGTPRSLQGRAGALVDALIDLLGRVWRPIPPTGAPGPAPDALTRCHEHISLDSTKRRFHHGLLGHRRQLFDSLGHQFCPFLKVPHVPLSHRPTLTLQLLERHEMAFDALP